MTKKTTEIIAELTSNIVDTGAIPISIPSNGILYGEDFKGVTLRAMTLDDEKAGSISQKNGGSPINTILDRCLGGAALDTLLPIDRDYLLIKLRELSFGDEFKAICPCPQCEASINLSFILSKLPAEPLPSDFKEPIVVNLPQSKLDVSLRLPRVGDEKYLTGETAFENLWRFVTSLRAEGGEEDYRDKEVISSVVEKLQIADVHSLVKGITLDNYGVQTKVKIACPTCERASVINLPLDQDFFTVTS